MPEVLDSAGGPYGHNGLTLRRYPLAFLRDEPNAQQMITCSDANTGRDATGCKVAGLVLLHQKPGSAKGVMFITIKDKTEVAAW